MNLITRQAVAILVSLIILAAPALAQQKRPAPAKAPPKPAAAPAPAPTFETLLPADSYAIYGEVRGAGQLVRSATVTELLEPILKLAAPSKEFKSIVKWLNAHSEQLMNSRLLLATASMNKIVPDTLVAVEFASPEEATKFVTPLNEFLPTILPAPTPSPTPKNDADKAAPSKAPAPSESAAPAPTFHLQRLGSLVVITQKPWTMKQLKPAGSKLLAEDANFRTIRNRFSSEPVFVFIDLKALQRQDDEQSKRAEEERQRVEEQAKQAAAAVKQEEKPAQAPETGELTDEEKAAATAAVIKTIPVPSGSEPAKDAPTPDPIFESVSELGSSFFGGTPDWPDALGVSLSFEGESFDLRALLVSAPGAKSGILPFMPKLIPGPAVAPESPNIFPADTELLLTMSLDLPQVYMAMSKAEPGSLKRNGDMVAVNDAGELERMTKTESPLETIEKRLKININNDLLPLLGSEIAIRLPTTGLAMVGPYPTMISGAESPTPSNAIAVAIAVRDKEALRTLMPKLVDSLGFKGASSLAQTERREDTELVSYANLFSYAFIGNFIVFSSDPAAVRQIVDSYLKHETLSSDIHFKNFTRWQPRQLQGQIYISPSLMESFKTMIQQPGTRMSDQTRAFLTRLSMTSQPITYALSNEGFGPLHEVHIPKNLVSMAVIGISGETNPSPMVQNERMAMGMMYTIAWAEDEYKTAKGHGSYCTLEQLIELGLVPKDGIGNNGYKFEVTVSADKFEVTAVPAEYGKSGTLSLFIDQSRVLRGADRSGASAIASDPAIH
jgi:hypothetical protein